MSLNVNKLEGLHQLIVFLFHTDRGDCFLTAQRDRICLEHEKSLKPKTQTNILETQK